MNRRDIIKELVRKAATKIKPQKVILFGSYAYGKPNKDSDVDLLFVKDTTLSRVDRYCLVSQNLEHLFPMDILVKTPQEIKKRLAMGDPFIKEIISKGQVIYESAN